MRIRLEMNLELGRMDPVWYLGQFERPVEVIGELVHAKVDVFGEDTVRVVETGGVKELSSLASCDEDIERLEGSGDIEWVSNPWCEVGFVRADGIDGMMFDPHLSMVDAIVAAVEAVEEQNELMRRWVDG